MNTMTISPLQHDYVTKKEFYAFKSYVKDGFEMTNKHIDNLEIHMNDRFTKLEDKIDSKFLKVDEKFALIDKQLITINDKFTSIDKQLLSLNTVVNKIATKIL